MGVAAALEGRFSRQVAHLPVPAGSQPIIKDPKMRGRVGRSHSKKLAAQPPGFPFNPQDESVIPMVQNSTYNP
jgi:hypothetical protein